MVQRDTIDKACWQAIPATRSAHAPDRRWAWRTADAAPVGGITCRLGDGACAGAHAQAVHRAAVAPDASVRRSLLKLQRDFGNQYVGQVLRAGSGPSGEEAHLDRIERGIGESRGAGQPMDSGTRSRMERALGADFSAVRIHTDARADGLARGISARAFATGNDLFFRQGEYDPGKSSGRELLAHELTHVVQQNGTGLQLRMTVSHPDDPHEQEAERVARAVVEAERAATPDEDDKARQAHSSPRHDEPPGRNEEHKREGAHDGAGAVG
ncbi:eCIS core domain-containing protein [Ideonella sp. YS5]|uniref:eCIS core domain-containing protein n=1 Tax=Ideonella sp. YS5 TaxID=3453714 RepID=UPI003EE9D613